MAMEDINDDCKGSYEQGCLTVCAPYSVCTIFCAWLNVHFSDLTTNINERAENFALHTTIGGLGGFYLGLYALTQQGDCDHSCICGKCRKLKRALQSSFAPTVTKMN